LTVTFKTPGLLTQSLPAGLALIAVLATVGLPEAAQADTPAPPPPVVHEVYPVPPGGTFTIAGHGSGHGHGLSQWGAYGAAKVAHLSSNQILAFYYPHTTLATKAVTQIIRVLLTAADAPAKGYLEFDPADGLEVTPAGGTAMPLPTEAPAGGGAIDLWRISKAGTALDLQAHWAGTWHDESAGQTPGLGVASATLSDTAGLLGVEVPNGSSTTSVHYRGSMVAELESGALQAVDDVTVESYVQSVTPAEMPASWTAAALQAQAVAARTYAWRAIAGPKASWYDLDGDTRDQAYPGAGVETTRTDNAVHSTAGEVAVDSTGAAIFAQYSSSDGGWTVSGDQPYLPSRRDPYDGDVPNAEHSWTATLTATAIAKAYPSIGTLQQLVITGRDGHGAWGGRVTEMSIVGSTATVNVTGSQFQSSFGLRSPWFRPSPAPGAPTAVSAAAAGHSVTVMWKPPSAVSGAAAVTGYRVKLAPGGQKTTVAATATTATFSSIAPGNYTATVIATSAAGAGPAASVPVTVKLL
jgi:SpoIID/LytB domain protein